MTYHAVLCFFHKELEDLDRLQTEKWGATYQENETIILIVAVIFVGMQISKTIKVLTVMVNLSWHSVNFFGAVSFCSIESDNPLISKLSKSNLK